LLVVPVLLARVAEYSNQTIEENKESDNKEEDLALEEEGLS